MLSFIQIYPNQNNLKGLTHTKLLADSVSDGINPPVLSAIRTFTTTAFPNARFLFVKKESNNYVIYSGDENGNYN
jgi:hypothetical protein